MSPKSIVTCELSGTYSLVSRVKEWHWLYTYRKIKAVGEIKGLFDTDGRDEQGIEKRSNSSNAGNLRFR